MAAQGTGFWADAVTEPKRAYRWVMNFRGIDQWMMKKVAKPNFTISESEHAFLNYKFYFPGRVEWAEISCTLVDPIQPDAAATLMKLLHDAGYVDPNDIDQANPITISKRKSIVVPNIATKERDACVYVPLSAASTRKCIANGARTVQGPKICVCAFL